MRLISNFQIFFLDLYKIRKTIWQLAKRDFKNNFLGSYLGIIWSFIQPLITILVLWFVFQVGFKAPPVKGNYPFILWLIAGMVPWFFFADAINAGTNSIVSYSYLVKKVVFKVSALPLIKIISCLFVHLILMAITLPIFLLYRYNLSLYTLQIFYYLFCMVVLLLGFSWITASLNVFTKDVSQIVTVIIQIGFWITPIIWDASILPVKYQYILKINPIYYITQGYRDALLYKVTFWDHHLKWTILFWVTTSIILLLGTVIFKKTKPHFADVL